MSWGVVYYKTIDGTVPARDFLLACPSSVRATMFAVLEAVRAAPPPQFSGGGKWEAMHGSMGGYHEIRVTGRGRTHYRLFCKLDNGTPQELAARGFDRPQIAVINGMYKPHRTEFRIASTERRSSISARITSGLCRVVSRRLVLATPLA